jgi:large subunit ribosomal protein L24
MKKDFSASWISSTKPNKQRKYRFNAPLHIRGSFLNVHLSKELRQKYSMRSLRVRVGDKVRIMRGQFKKQEGKVEEADLRNSKIYISKVEHTKRDGTKARYPIDPSNVMIVELDAEDKRRLAKQVKTPKKEKPKIEKSKPESRAAKPKPKNKHENKSDDKSKS